MRLPFEFDNSKFDDSRVKFIYTSPEHHQNIEISIDGDKTSVETLIETFERFLGALGISIPKNVVLSFVEIDDEDDENDEEKEDNEFEPEDEEDKDEE